LRIASSTALPQRRREAAFGILQQDHEREAKLFDQRRVQRRYLLRAEQRPRNVSGRTVVNFSG
jgi:hypothetical protein